MKFKINNDKEVTKSYQLLEYNKKCQDLGQETLKFLTGGDKERADIILNSTALVMTEAALMLKMSLEDFTQYCKTVYNCKLTDDPIVFGEHYYDSTSN